MTDNEIVGILVAALIVYGSFAGYMFWDGWRLEQRFIKQRKHDKGKWDRRRED